MTIADIALNGTKEAAGALPGEHHAVHVDVGEEDSVTEMVHSVAARSGRLDTIIHCAGISLQPGR